MNFVTGTRDAAASVPRGRAAAGARALAALASVLSGPAITASGAAAGLAGVASLGGLAAAGAGCSLSQDGVPPPAQRIFFPSGALVDPTAGRWLYVVNSNSDLRYNAGTVAVVDLDRVCADDERSTNCPMPLHPNARSWPSCSADPRYVPPAQNEHACCWDVVDRNILTCDEQAYIVGDRTVRMGSFAVQPAMQRFPIGAPSDPNPMYANLGRGVSERLFVPVRGNTSITMMDVIPAPADAPDAGPRLICTGPRPGAGSLGAEQPPFALCDEQWRLTRKNETNPEAVPEDQVVRLPDEPYALAIDDWLGLMYVGHLRTGEVTLFDLGGGDDAQRPDLVHSAQGVLPPDGNGSRGVTSLKIASPGTCFGKVYVTSRFRAVATSMIVFGAANPGGCGERDGVSSRDLAVVGTGETFAPGLVGTETRGFEIVGDRFFVLQRTPPAVVAFDAGNNAPAAVVEVCQSPTTLALHTQKDGRPMLYVTCFDAGEVFVVDPAIPTVRAVIPIGRGPVLTAFSDTDPTRAYVVGFGANNISVLDLDPGRSTYNHVIQRIGFPSATPRPPRAE